MHLAELLGIFAGVGARGVDKGDDGKPKVVRMAHEAQRLAVAVGLRHAKVAVDVLLHVRTHISAFQINTTTLSPLISLPH